MRCSVALVTASLIATSAQALKPGGSPTPPNQQVAYRLANNSSVSLLFANEDGSATSTVYTGRVPFRFDLGPPVQGVRNVAVVQQPATGTVGTVFLVPTSVNTSGLLVGGTPQQVGTARGSSNVSFSPDGTKLAYACCSDGQQESLVVKDLLSGAVTTWARAPYFWDIQWFRGGNSLAYATLGRPKSMK